MLIKVEIVNQMKQPNVWPNGSPSNVVVEGSTEDCSVWVGITFVKHCPSFLLLCWGLVRDVGTQVYHF